MKRSQVGIEESEDRRGCPEVGRPAPEFLIDRPSGQISLREFAAEVGTVILVTQDYYKFHGT